MERIKVLQITQASGAGVQKYVLQLCQYLDKRRFAVTGCCSQEGSAADANGDVPFAEAFAHAGIPYFAIPMQRTVHPWRDACAFGKLYQFLKTQQFHIVHAHSSKAGALARIAGRLANVPVIIYSPHAFAFDGPGAGPRRLSYLGFEKIASWFGNVIVADSPGEKALALKHRLTRETTSAVIPPSLALEDYDPYLPEQERSEIRTRVGIPPRAPVVSMINRLAPQKDPFTFILAACALAGTVPEAKFLVVGDGPLREGCERKARECGIADRVKFLGWRRDYAQILRASDVLVSTSLWEGLPFILLEAMAFAKPVVATRCTGVVDLIVEGENGLLVPPRAHALLAEKVRLVLEDPCRASVIGARGRETVESKYRVGGAVSELEMFYLRLMEASGNKF
jgi:glycosyltransferase involved in cell wall biosynthesis